MSAQWTAIEDALVTLLAEARVASTRLMSPLLSSLGKVLASDIVAEQTVPPFDNSAMDGYAVRVADLLNGQSVTVTQRIAAGSVGREVLPGEAARIFTGAAMPLGADAVLMQENAIIDGDQLSTEQIIPQANNVRRAGKDVAKGAIVFKAGHRLKPQDLGVLASIGLTELPIYAPLKVAVISTGDELREPGETLQRGQIFNSNRYTLYGLISSLGAEVVDLGICEDTPQATEAILRKAADSSDLVISTGGVSVGEEDHVKSVVERLGELKLWKLAIKPGKPLAYGRVLGLPFIGLPGNPASVFVTFNLVARPYILSLQGATDVTPVTVFVAAGFSTQSAGRRQEYLRARVVNIDGCSRVEIYSQQSSDVLTSTAWANCLAIVPAGKIVSEGDIIEVMLFEGLLS